MESKPLKTQNQNISKQNTIGQNESKVSISNIHSNPQLFLKQSQMQQPFIIPPCSLKDDDSKPIENSEKALDRQQASTESYIPTISALASIGKNNQGPAQDNVLKPVTIMSLDDRDIVVIDKADIKESMKHEGNVIVVNKQQNEIDLVDLLGGNWPEYAGDAALVLNKAKQSQNTELKQGLASMSSKPSSLTNYSLKKSIRNKGTLPSKLRNFNNVKQEGLLLTQKQEEIAVTAASSALLSSGASSKVLKFKEMDKAPVYDNVINAELSTSATAEKSSIKLGDDVILTSSALENPLKCLGVGSMVEISIAEIPEDLYGVIRWVGSLPDSKTVMIGVELEDNQDSKDLPTTDGSFNGVSLFKCQEGRALLVHPSQCSKDRRFVDVDDSDLKNLNSKKQKDTKMFGQVECPSVPGAVSPLKIYNLEELKDVCGKFKGIQGHHNSCYLDATLFSMFTFTHVFDSLLFRPSEADDISHYDEVQKVLREEIVNPLRRNVFVRADRVMKLRQLLDKLSSVSGLTSEEKDPEEFLNSLLAQIMRVEPFLKLSSGQDAFFYQLFVEKDERLLFPSVQQLFEQSFQSSDIKLKEVPSCLIIQMPRFGKNFKMYSRILPSQVLDVTDIIEDSPRQCSVCGKLSEYECRDCFGILQCGVGLESTSFCEKCLKTVHLHTKRANHNYKEISVPHDFKIMADHMNVPRLYMELFAVVCIETSHYVAFVKAGSGPDAPWCFFDSMADRKGEKNGYNIPEIITIPDLPLWLSEEGARTVNEMSSNDKMLPEHAKRLFCDAYMCMYQSTDVMMYR